MAAGLRYTESRLIMFKVLKAWMVNENVYSCKATLNEHYNYLNQKLMCQPF